MISFSGMRKGSVSSDGAPWHDDPCSYVEEKAGYRGCLPRDAQVQVAFKRDRPNSSPRRLIPDFFSET
jgi:hypothetical protein